MFHPHLSLLRSITSTPGVANTWWRHQMHGNICRVTGLCAGNSPVIGEFPHKGQWRGALMFSLISAWINSWVNNREAGDFRRHRAHYDVIVMRQPSSLWRRLSHGTKHQSLRATTTLKSPPPPPPPDKMAVISQTIISDAFVNEMFCIWLIGYCKIGRSRPCAWTICVTNRLSHSQDRTSTSLAIFPSQFKYSGNFHLALI